MNLHEYLYFINVIDCRNVKGRTHYRGEITKYERNWGEGERIAEYCVGIIHTRFSYNGPQCFTIDIKLHFSKFS